jgi:Fusaric acid resistance protein-like
VSPPRATLAEKLRDVLRKEIKNDELLRALVVIGPLVAAYVVLREPALLNLGLVAISLLIPALKLGLPPRAVALHFLAILITFSVLFLAAPIKPLFVALTALAGFLAVAVIRYGDALRTLGNWVFIPAVYLACEVREGVSETEALRHAGVIVATSPIALALVCGVQFYDHARDRYAGPSHYGAALADWFLPAAATASAVLAAAVLVEVFDLAQGQWVIWSAASVVVGDLSASTGKLKQRAAGALVGVPLGLLVGHALPQNRVGYSLAVLCATLTLIAFPRYPLAFGARCFFIALAAAFAGGASGIAEERVANVIIGGLFGLVAVALTDLIWRRIAPRPPGQTPVS